jgi:hypothetical protein
MTIKQQVARTLGTGGILVLAVFAVGATTAAAQKPAAKQSGPPVLDRDVAAWLVTLPLNCVDKLQDAPRGRGYLYEVSATLRPDFAKTRAFYGCSDWHSAVNSTWTLVTILRMFPDLRVAGLIRGTLKQHLTADAIKGEVAFLNEPGSKSFERPYGWAWLLRLYGELRSWDDPDAKKWAANLEPLATLLVERTVPYLQTLAAPMRIGTHANTAYTLRLLLEYATSNRERALEEAVVERAKKFYALDTGCAPNVEVSGSDFFSPCLEEAALMSRVLPAAEFATWLDAFLPAPTSPAFKELTVSLSMSGSNEDLEKADMLGAKAHLIGLPVSRARALENIAAGLPPGDPRIAPYRKFAASNAQAGIEAMYEADYAGTHWIATYILDYLLSAQAKPQGT